MPIPNMSLYHMHGWSNFIKKLTEINVFIINMQEKFTSMLSLWRVIFTTDLGNLTHLLKQLEIKWPGELKVAWKHEYYASYLTSRTFRFNIQYSTMGPTSHLTIIYIIKHRNQYTDTILFFCLYVVLLLIIWSLENVCLLRNPSLIYL